MDPEVVLTTAEVVRVVMWSLGIGVVVAIRNATR